MNNKEYLVPLEALHALQKYLTEESVLQSVASSPSTISSSNRLTNRTVSISLSDDDVERLLNELTEVLTRYGLGENDEPNKIGILVEDMIDIFTR